MTVSSVFSLNVGASSAYNQTACSLAPDVAGAYAATRFATDRGWTAGALAAIDPAPVLDRVLPG